MRAPLLVIGLIGCADVPEFGFDDGSLVASVNGETGAVIVSGSFYEMEFGLPGPDTFPMPDKFTVGVDDNRRDVLTDAIPTCAFEARVGLAFFPGLDISSLPGRLGPGGVAETSRIDQIFEGPGAIQYEVTYRASYVADTQPLVFEGKSTFTFFAPGRITRYDEFTPFDELTTLTGPADPFGCSTGPVDTFFLTSYWAFENTGAPTQIRRDGTLAIDGDREACTFYDSHDTMIGVAWPEPAAGEFVRYRPGGGLTAGHVFDFLSDGSGNGLPEVPGGQRSVSSSLIVDGFRTEANECDVVLDSLTSGQLLINDTPFMADPDGIYRQPDNMPNEGTITLKSMGRLAAGVAVILDLGSARHAEILKDNASEPPAYIQQLDDQRVLIVLRDELRAGETVTIEPF